MAESPGYGGTWKKLLVIYLVIAVVAYLVIYLVFLRDTGGTGGTGGDGGSGPYVLLPLISVQGLANRLRRIRAR